MLNFLRLPHCPTLQLTKPGHKSDAGYDIHLAEDHLVLPYNQIPFNIETEKYELKHAKTGIVLIPDNYDYWYGIYSRSSNSKKGIGLANFVGVIDPAYTGEILLALYAHHQPVLLKAGERVAQLVIQPRIDQTLQEVDIDPRTIKRGGFGSTDKKIG